jgi:hypothetical protein
MMDTSLSTRRIAVVAARFSSALACASLFTACGGDDAVPAPAPAPSSILTAATEPRLTSESVQLLTRVSAAWADVTAGPAPAQAATRSKPGVLAALGSLPFRVELAFRPGGW